MRIGIVLSQTPGYSETFFTSKIKGLQANGLDVLIFAQKKSNSFTLCPVILAPKVYRFKLLQLFAMAGVFISLLPKLLVVRKLMQLEKKGGASRGSILKKVYLNAHLLKANLDWLHFGFATQALGSECVSKAIGAKMAVSFRGFDINVYPLKHPGCYQTLWKHVDKVHSISNYLRDKAIGLGLSAKTPYQIITPAITITTLPKIQSSTQDILQLVTIARLTWIKGLDTAIAAMGFLKKQGIAFQYHIIGDGTTKDTERYSFQVYEEKLQAEILFHGKLAHDKTLEMLQKADIYIQPSINEGFCNAVLEAQALGKLVIASNVGGLPENIKNGETGWLVPEGDATALARNIVQCITMTEGEKAKISQNAKDRVHREFSIAQQQQEFLSFYSKTV